MHLCILFPNHLWMGIRGDREREKESWGKENEDSSASSEFILLPWLHGCGPVVLKAETATEEEVFGFAMSQLFLSLSPFISFPIYLSLSFFLSIFFFLCPFSLKHTVCHLVIHLYMQCIWYFKVKANWIRTFSVNVTLEFIWMTQDTRDRLLKWFVVKPLDFIPCKQVSDLVNIIYRSKKGICQAGADKPWNRMFYRGSYSVKKVT